MAQEITVDSKEYIEELFRRFQEGGIIWLIERTDTHEFYYPSMSPRIHVFGKGEIPRYCQWHKEITMFVATSGFLTKEDAVKYSWMRDGFERGCPNCGYGGIPTTITEHEFVSPKPLTTQK